MSTLAENPRLLPVRGSVAVAPVNQQITVAFLNRARLEQQSLQQRECAETLLEARHPITRKTMR